eukprot:6246163-Prorocentrum_lima.AAC.1
MDVVDRLYIRGRVKRPYSIHRKMKKKNLERIDQLHDLVALRVVVGCSLESARRAVHSIDEDEEITPELKAD